MHGKLRANRLGLLLSNTSKHAKRASLLHRKNATETPVLRYSVLDYCVILNSYYINNYLEGLTD